MGFLARDREAYEANSVGIRALLRATLTRGADGAASTDSVLRDWLLL